MTAALVAGGRWLGVGCSSVQDQEWRRVDQRGEQRNVRGPDLLVERNLDLRSLRRLRAPGPLMARLSTSSGPKAPNRASPSRGTYTTTPTKEYPGKFVGSVRQGMATLVNWSRASFRPGTATTAEALIVGGITTPTSVVVDPERQGDLTDLVRRPRLLEMPRQIWVVDLPTRPVSRGWPVRNPHSSSRCLAVYACLLPSDSTVSCLDGNKLALILYRLEEPMLGGVLCRDTRPM